MEEKRRSLIVLGVIGVCIFLLLVISAISNENKVEVDEENNSSVAETYSGNYSTDYNEAFSGEGRKVLLIGSSTCGFCARFRPYMNYLSEAYKFQYYYIDAAEMSNSDLKSILEKVGADINDFGTPYTVILENGQKISDIGGYIEEDKLFEKLQTNGVISSDATYTASESLASNEENPSDDDSSYTNLSFIDYTGYEEIYNSKEKSIVVLGQTGCSACNAFKPTIDQIAEENGVKIYYVNMTKLTSGESQKLMNSLSYFDDLESWGTPLTLIIENKEVIDDQKGASSKDTTVEFFKKNGFIK